MDPKPHVVWWTLIRVFKVFPSQNLMCFDGPTTQLKPHVFWWTQNLMWFDGPLMIFRVHQITWGFWVHQNTGVHKKLMWFDGPIISTPLGPSNHMRFLLLLWLTSINELILFWFKQCFCNFHYYVQILETGRQLILWPRSIREINGWDKYVLLDGDHEKKWGF